MALVNNIWVDRIFIVSHLLRHMTFVNLLVSFFNFLSFFWYRHSPSEFEFFFFTLYTLSQWYRLVCRVKKIKFRWGVPLFVTDKGCWLWARGPPQLPEKEHHRLNFEEIYCCKMLKNLLTRISEKISNDTQNASIYNMQNKLNVRSFISISQ